MLHFLKFSFFFGIFDDIGVELGLPVIYRKAEKIEYGLGSISTSVKWLFMEQNNNIPALVLGLELGFPTNSISDENEELSYEISPYIAFLKDFGHLCIQGNFAYTIEMNVSGDDNNFVPEFNIALSYPVIEEKFYFLAEMNNSWFKIKPNEIYAAPGLKYYINDENFLAFALPINLNKNQNSEFRFIFQYQLQL